MVFTSVSGHLLALEFVGQYMKWYVTSFTSCNLCKRQRCYMFLLNVYLQICRYGCDPVSLFDAPVEKYCPDNFKDIKVRYLSHLKFCVIVIMVRPHGFYSIVDGFLGLAQADVRQEKDENKKML